MSRFIVVLAFALVLGPVLSLAAGDRLRTILGGEPAAVVRPPAEVRQSGAPPADSGRVEPAPAPAAYRQVGEDSLYRRAARTAWAYVEGQYHPSTGMVNSVVRYPYATVWDIGSALAALYSAGELGLIEPREYDRRMRRALETLQSLRLFDEGAFNKTYQIARAVPAGRNNRVRPPRADGYGWSATDLGRLLVWLKIIATEQPQHARAAEAVVRRIDFDRVVKDGYLWGESLAGNGKVRSYQEGRVGYEQYAAAGFALWEEYADRALRIRENAREVEVLGVPVLVDRRGEGRLTAEPYFLMGLELGWWDPEWREQAGRILAAQRARYEKTGRLTMVSEDALPVPPYYFYYYTIYDDGEPFAVSALGERVPRPEPRWLSTKAAFAWYALLPGDYTWRALQAVADRAAHPRLGWSSGISERDGTPTGSQNINTAAVILEAALYRVRGRPLLVDAARGDD